jgi:hypothetical protein
VVAFELVRFYLKRIGLLLRGRFARASLGMRDAKDVSRLPPVRLSRQTA